MNCVAVLSIYPCPSEEINDCIGYALITYSCYTHLDNTGCQNKLNLYLNMYYLLYGLEGQFHNSSFHFLLFFFHVNAPWQQISSYIIHVFWGCTVFIEAMPMCKICKYANVVSRYLSIKN